MKKEYNVAFAILLVLFFGLSSCKKNGQDAPTKSENLTRSSWKFSSATAGGIDISNNPDISCIKDDVVTFQVNGNGNVNEGANVCNPTTAGNFTWTLQNNETQLVMSSGLFPAGSGTFTIVSLSETTLVISQNVFIPPSSSTSVLVTATYTH